MLPSGSCLAGLAVIGVVTEVVGVTGAVVMPAHKPPASDLQGKQEHAVLVLKSHLWVRRSYRQKVWPWHRLTWAVFSPAEIQV